MGNFLLNSEEQSRISSLVGTKNIYSFFVTDILVLMMDVINMIAFSEVHNAHVKEFVMEKHNCYFYI